MATRNCFLINSSGVQLYKIKLADSHIFRRHNAFDMLVVTIISTQGDELSNIPDHPPLITKNVSPQLCIS